MATKITMKRGDTRTIDFTFTESDGTTPINLTGGKVFFTANASAAPTDDSAAVISKSTTTFSGAALGQCSITLDAADTTNVTPGTYNYDAQFVSSGGVVVSSPTGTLIISADITRRIV